jgi:hypothetical protein
MVTPASFCSKPDYVVAATENRYHITHIDTINLILCNKIMQATFGPKSISTKTGWKKTNKLRCILGTFIKRLSIPIMQTWIFRRMYHVTSSNFNISNEI